MPAAVSRTTLKGYFNAGDEPTETNFATTIDSLASTYDDNYMTGSMQITGSLSVKGAFTSTVMKTPVLLSDPGDTDADALVENTHAGTHIVIPAIGQNSTWTIPTPSAAGVWYHFIYHSTATEAQNVILKTVTTDGSVDMRGSINHIVVDPDNTATNAQLAAFGDGDSNDILTIATPSSIDLWFVAGATDYWYTWGTITSATKPVFSDS
jgi:hypothetical protein